MERMGDTMLQMVSKRLLLDLVQRGAHGADLREHVDAVPLLLNHSGDPTHLPLYAAEPGELRFL